MGVALVPPLVLVVGVLAWALSGNPKIQRMGEWGFVIGLFFTVARFAGAVVHF